jgi:hypothetical protein
MTWSPPLFESATNIATHSGHEVAGLFQRMLNRRLIPDYFDVIKEPTAFSTVRVSKICADLS